METRFALGAGLHACQTVDRPRMTLEEKLCCSELDEKYIEYVTFNDVFRRMKKFVGRKMTLKHPMSVQWGDQNPRTKFVNYRWKVIPRGTVVSVYGITEPQVFLEPEVNINPATREVMSAKMVRIQKHRNEELFLTLSQHVWIYLAWKVFVEDTRNLFPNTAFGVRDRNQVPVHATMLELYYCLAPEEFYEITERVLPRVRLWHLCDGRSEAFRTSIDGLWEQYWSAVYRINSRYKLSTYGDYRAILHRDNARTIQESFNDLCEREGFSAPLYFSPQLSFTYYVGDLVEGQAYWGAEFWGPRQTSPMQMRVRAFMDANIFNRRHIVLMDLRAWSEDEVAKKTYKDPYPTEIEEGDPVWDVEPGKSTLVQGAISVCYQSDQGKMYSNIVDFVRAVGMRLPISFSPTDPWVDRPVGRRRQQYWEYVKKALMIVSKAGQTDRYITLRKPLMAKFHARGGFVRLNPGRKIRVAPMRGDLHGGFSDVVVFLNEPTDPNMTPEEMNWPIDKQLMAGLYKYKDLAYDILDEDLLFGAVSLFALANIVKPGSIPKIQE